CPFGPTPTLARLFAIPETVRNSRRFRQTVDTQVTKSASQISLPLPEQSVPAAATPDSVPATIDFKGISLPVMQVALSRLEPAQIAAAIQARFGKNAGGFFDY